MATPIVALLALFSATPEQKLLDDVRYAVGAGSEPRIQSLFARTEDSQYLLSMGRARGGLRSLGVQVIPPPPGWGFDTPLVHFHTFQDIEAYHDPVYTTLRTGQGLKIGREIPQVDAGGARIDHADISVRLHESEGKADVSTLLAIKPEGAAKAPMFRLNDVYSLSAAQMDGKTAQVVTADGKSVPKVSAGQVLRAGSLLIPWSAIPPKSTRFTYSGVVKREREDKVTPRMAYLTAWWVPSIARLPHTTATTIDAPASWVARSEGILQSEKVSGDRQMVTYRCDLPISYPKVVAGAYVLAGSLTDRGRTFRAYQFAPVDAAKGQKSVELAAEAVAFFEDRFGKFPFPGYDVFDAEGYYGIESYSYTLLNKQITNTFIGHEIGHTYFGGMAPNAYTVDSWNEGVTQYVDSVLFRNNADRSLNGGLASWNLRVPLTAMPRPHEHNSQSYMRGALVMKMLENEIGTDAVVAGLRALAAERRGKETTWPDLRQYFEKSSGSKLDWFWSQWIHASEFPSLDITRAVSEDWNGKRQVRATVRQHGTKNLYRLRFKVVAVRGPQTAEKVVTMTSPEAVFEVPADFIPQEVKLEVLGYALVKPGPPFRLQ